MQRISNNLTVYASSNECYWCDVLTIQWKFKLCHISSKVDRTGPIISYITLPTNRSDSLGRKYSASMQKLLYNFHVFYQILQVRHRFLFLSLKNMSTVFTGIIFVFRYTLYFACVFESIIFKPLSKMLLIIWTKGKQIINFVL